LLLVKEGKQAIQEKTKQNIKDIAELQSK